MVGSVWVEDLFYSLYYLGFLDPEEIFMWLHNLWSLQSNISPSGSWSPLVISKQNKHIPSVALHQTEDVKNVNTVCFKVSCQLHPGENIAKCCKSCNLLPALGERVGRTNKLHGWLSPCFFVRNNVWSTSWTLVGVESVKDLSGWFCLRGAFAITYSNSAVWWPIDANNNPLPSLPAHSGAGKCKHLEYISFELDLFLKNIQKKYSCVF